ncbi:NUDIX hydrolase [Flexivirga sp. ID2601S]|uniref:NUDIX hydrolase n=1 Tax=Flexivirga aerilata TaxID=1656889 RepID=A0A849AHR2_9MICO|nr:NUDIX hydrolase [Flexivirga aerilata]NNG38738.1 NUDIX hydrolase [Flexivirga aerilata]
MTAAHRAGDQRLVAETPEAPWLPPGSTAEVWAGADCDTPDPSIIVRLLITRLGDETEFFCVPTPKGPDLPTRFLGPGAERSSADDGLRHLQQETVDDAESSTRCVGFVRNVVPHPDGDYPHPTPDAYVPVFAAERAHPVVPGEWFTLDSAPTALHGRHWWPIVRRYLEAAGAGH